MPSVSYLLSFTQEPHLEKQLSEVNNTIYLGVKYDVLATSVTGTKSDDCNMCNDMLMLWSSCCLIKYGH